MCKSCWLAKTEKCQALQAYLIFQKNIPKDDNLRITITNTRKDVTLTVDSIKETLDKLKVRETSRTYKIAKIIFESDNSPFSEVFKKIQDVLGEGKTLNYAKTRFYQIKRLIEEKTDIRVNIVTQKFLQLGKEIKPEQNI